MSSLLRTVLILAAGAVAVPACAADPPPTGVAPPTRIPRVEKLSSGPAGEPVAITALARALRRAVVADAAQRFNVAESAVVLASAERVTWNDASLGCPQHGQMYTQALVPGFRVVARADAGLLVYHTDENQRVVTCAAMAPQPGLPES